MLAQIQRNIQFKLDGLKMEIIVRAWGNFKPVRFSKPDWFESNKISDSNAINMLAQVK